MPKTDLDRIAEIELQAQNFMTAPLKMLIKNIIARIPGNWGFGIIFYERSRSAPPTVWMATHGREEFVDVAEEFVQLAKSGDVPAG